MSSSMPSPMHSSPREHPPAKHIADGIEDASKATYEFVKMTFKGDIVKDCPRTGDHLSQIRAELDDVKRQLTVSSLHVETLRRALDLSREARESLRTRGTDLLSKANQVVRHRSSSSSILPPEILSYIAKVLHWENRAATHAANSQPHDEWVHMMYPNAATKTVFVQAIIDDETDQQFPCSYHEDSFSMDSKIPLVLHYSFIPAWAGRWSMVPTCQNTKSSHQAVLSTSYRWQELHLRLSTHPNCFSFLQLLRAEVMPNLSYLSIREFHCKDEDNSLVDNPTWWGVESDAKEFGCRTFPKLISASMSLKYLPTSGVLFSNLLHLTVLMPGATIAHPPLCFALHGIPNLTTLEIRLHTSESSVGLGGDNMVKEIQGVRNSNLQALTISGSPLSTANIKDLNLVFEFKNLLTFSGHLPTNSDDIANIMKSLHDCFPIVRELNFFEINTYFMETSTVTRTTTVIRNLSYALDGRWLFPSLACLGISFMWQKEELHDLVQLAHNRRRNKITNPLLRLKLPTVQQQWETNLHVEQRDEVLECLITIFYDVQVFNPYPICQW